MASPQLCALLGLSLLAAACEGTSPVTPPADPGDPSNPGDPALSTTPIPEPRACQVQLNELAVYQAVKVPLIVQGQAAASLNAPIIEGRRAYFRAFLSLAGGAAGNVRANLSLQAGGAAPRVFQQMGLVEVDSQDSNLATTLNFDVPADAIGADTTASLELELGDSCPGGGRVRYPTAGPMPLAPRSTGTLKLVLVPVVYDADNSGRMPDVSPEQLQRYQEMLLAYYPTRSVDLQVHEAVSSNVPLTANGGWNALLESLRELRQRDGVGPDIYYYGLVSPAVTFSAYCRSACTAGLSYLAEGPSMAARQVGAGVGFSGNLAGETLVHEIGHQHGRGHSPCGGGAGIDKSFPYSDGGIGVWGFDFRTMRLRAPQGSPSMAFKDFMGYCNPQWISDYTFSALANRRAAISGAAAYQRDPGNLVSGLRSDRSPFPGAPARQVLLIGAGGDARWGRPLPVDQAPEGLAVNAQALDAAGAVIQQVTVYRTEYGHGGGASFEVPAVESGWSALAIDGQPPVRYAAIGAAVPALQPLNADRLAR